MKNIFILFAVALSSFASVYVADSTSLADVQAKVSLATNNDIVIIPAGASTWSSELVISNKALTLLGMGTSTVITKNTSGYLIMGNGTPTNLLRISNFKIIGNNLPSTSYQIVYIGPLTGSSFLVTNIARVDHMYITNLNQRGVGFGGWSLSLLDHCRIDSGTTAQHQLIDVTGLGNANFTSGPALTNAYLTNAVAATNAFPSWDSIALSPGTTNMVVAEDNIFVHNLNSGNGTIDSYNGARWALRFNRGNNLSTGDHGTDSGGSSRGTVWWEVYGNTWSNYYSVAPFAFRGGSGVIFSNTITQVSGSPVNGINIYNYKSMGTNYGGGPEPCCLPFGPAWISNYYTGKVDSTGYPSFDQIGVAPPTTYTATSVVQSVIGVYQWTNLFNGALGCRFGDGSAPYNNTGSYAYIPNSTNYLVSGRDYFDDTPKPGYTPLAYPHPLTLLDPLITFTSNPTGATITTTPDLNAVSGGTTPMTNLYVIGQPITNTAAATHNGGPFIQWNRDGVFYSTNQTIEVTVDQARTFSAVYTNYPAVVISGNVQISGMVSIQ